MTQTVPNMMVTNQPMANALKQALEEVAYLDADLAAYQRRHASRVAYLTLDTLSQRDEAGKPILTNEEARKAAVAVNVARDEECAKIITRIEDLQRARAFSAARAEALRAAIRLTAAQLLSQAPTI